MILRYHPVAFEEVDRATIYYRQTAGRVVAENLQRELFLLIDQIFEEPTRWQLRQNGTRRVNLAHFPYYISFLIKDDCIWIVAVAHEARRPFYWNERLRDLS